jgi:hypothetical protein
MARARSRPAPAKWPKFIAGILLIPLCVATARTAFRIIRATTIADFFWIPFLAGAACWLTIYIFLPKPLWLYVCGHELTHALWAKLFGAKVKSIKITARGGFVTLTKTNFLISLAPYFFPFYAVSILITFNVGVLIWDLRPWFPVLYLLLGAAYCFHLTLTGHALSTKQTDISEQGYLFSAVVIWLGNVGVLIFCLCPLTDKMSLWAALNGLTSDTVAVVTWIFHLAFRVKI